VLLHCQLEISDQMPGIEVSKENPPSGRGKSFRRSHRGATVRLLFHIVCAVKILLTFL
jgi:hypothetical protein